jgi:hypothetical protein
MLVVVRLLRAGRVAGGLYTRPACEMHRALGFAGGARGVDQDRQVLARRLAQALLQHLRVLPPGAAPCAARPGDITPRVVQIAQAFHVEHDDLAQARQRARTSRALSSCSSSSTNSTVCASPRTGTAPGSGVGRVDAVAHAAAAGWPGRRQHPFDHRVLDRMARTLAALEAQAQQAGGDLAHRLAEFAQVQLRQMPYSFWRSHTIGPRLPPRSRTSRDGVSRPARHAPWERVQRLAWGGPHLQFSSSSSAARRARRFPSCRGRTP